MADLVRDPSCPVFVRYEKTQNAIGEHTHDGIEVVVVDRGSARHRVCPSGPDAAGPREHRLTAGDAFVVAPGEQHAYADTAGLRLWNLLFDPRLLIPCQAELAEVPALRRLLLGQSSDGALLHLTVAARRNVDLHLRILADELAQERPGRLLLVSLHLVGVLVALARAVPSTGVVTGEPRPVELALAFMRSHFSQPLTLDGIAARAMLHPRWFCQVFRQATGDTPMAHLQRLRVEAAQHLLRTTRQEITAIAHAVGFADSSHFARVFRRLAGCSPLAWRQAVQPPRPEPRAGRT